MKFKPCIIFTVQLSHVPVISQPMLVTQAPPLIMATQFMPLLPAKQSIPILPVQQTLPQVPPQTSGIGCLGPECSALGLKGIRITVFELVDRKLVKAPSNFIACRPKAALLFWFRCGEFLFIAILVI